MTPEQIKQLAKQAGGTPYVNQHFPGKLAVAFSGESLIEFVRLVRESDIGQDEERLKVIAHLRHAYKQYGNELDQKAANMLSANA